MVCCTIVRLAGLAYLRGRSFRSRLLSLVRPDPVMIRRGVIAIKPAENNDGPGHGPRTMARLNILLILKSPLDHSARNGKWTKLFKGANKETLEPDESVDN